MIFMLSKNFIQSRVSFYENLIAVYENAMLALSNPDVEEYMIDTGQTKQRVKRANINDVQKTLDNIYNQHSMWCNRLNSGGSTIVVPQW